GPPQSASVSSPSLRPSPQGRGAHSPKLQKRAAQSASPWQPAPSGQGRHEPPQSRSVSSPSFWPFVQWASPQGKQEPPQSTPVSSPLPRRSRQDGGWQRFASHTRLKQSTEPLQRLPSPQGQQVLPPQSTSLSRPLRTPSQHHGPSHAPFRQNELWQSRF